VRLTQYNYKVIRDPKLDSSDDKKERSVAANHIDINLDKLIWNIVKGLLSFVKGPGLNRNRKDACRLITLPRLRSSISVSQVTSPQAIYAHTNLSAP